MTPLGTGFDVVLTRAALGALLAAAAWTTLVVVSLAVEARSGGRVCVAERLGCPRFVRAWVLGVLLASCAGIAPAQATGTGSGSAIDTALDGLPLPERTLGTTPSPAAPGADPLVVRPGDSLWRLAAEHLPAGSGRADVAAVVAALYTANRSRIGPDPDRLTPGEHLDLPHPTTLPEAP